MYNEPPPDFLKNALFPEVLRFALNCGLGLDHQTRTRWSQTAFTNSPSGASSFSLKTLSNYLAGKFLEDDIARVMIERLCEDEPFGDLWNELFWASVRRARLVNIVETHRPDKIRDESLAELFNHPTDESRNEFLSTDRVIELAQLINRDILDIDDAWHEIEAMLVLASGHFKLLKLDEPKDSFIGDLSKKVSVEPLQQGAKLIDEAIVELDASRNRLESQKDQLGRTLIQILEMGVKQDLLLRKPEAAAAKEFSKLKLTSGTLEPFTGIIKLSEHYLAKGRDKGATVYLSTASELVRIALSLARGSQQKAIALNADGNVTLRLGERQREKEIFNEALGLFEAARALRNKADFPLDWAETTSNIGNMMWFLGDRENDSGFLREAAKHYKDAGDVRKEHGDDVAWGNSMNNLAAALYYLGSRNKGDDEYIEAIEICKKAHSVRTKKNAPVSWAQTMVNLGNAQRGLGANQQDLRLLEASKTSLLGALEVLTRESDPNGWAISQNSLGETIGEIGKIKQEIETLEEGIAVLEDAAIVRTLEASPLQWAKTQFAKGKIYSFLVQCSSGEHQAESLHLASKALSAAITEFYACGADWYCSEAEKLLSTHNF